MPKKIRARHFSALNLVQRSQFYPQQIRAPVDMPATNREKMENVTQIGLIREYFAT